MQDWRKLSVEQLHRCYEQEHFAANMAEVVAGFAQRSQQVRATRSFETFRYGPEHAEDGLWARPDADSATPELAGDIVCFIHGGAWRTGKAESYLYPADWVCREGMHYVALNFGNVLDFQGRLFPMVEQLTRGLTWVICNAGSYGAVPRIHLVGHSSGAHLAACLAVLDWSVLVPEHPQALRDVLLCSGIYDLEPVSYSSRRTYLQLDPVEIHALSPYRQSFDPRVPIAITYGNQESPEFIRQSKALAQKLRAAGVPVREAMAEGLNHFEICGTFDCAEGFLGRFFMEGLRSS